MENRIGITRPALLPLACLLACLALLPGFFLPAQAARQQEPFERLFGYEAFPADAKDFPLHIKKHWLKVLKVERDTPCLRRDASCLPQADAPHWLYLAAKSPKMDETELLRSVNAFFNKYPSVSSVATFGANDGWPTPTDFVNRRAGDCKAYPVAKYFALRALGVSDDKLRIVLMHMPQRKITHSVLAVATARGVFILDHNTRPIDLIQTQDKYNGQCIPLLMLNEKGRWTFKQDMKLLTHN